ncbi:hypothetical protein [Salinibacter grassmerensis]|uniref:hypothetical protein n=1 Tax=Salinibacter grassmerensis TaxID=3040353 RepID=UPI0021E940F1|nr:hypothetical protein [Salinibacter grassmerensis]
MENLPGPDRPDADCLAGHLRRNEFVLERPTSSSGPSALHRRKDPQDKRDHHGCAVMEEARKYRGSSAGTRTDEIETEEEAGEYLKGLRRRYEEGETTRLP